jgi:predicted ATPase
MLLTIFATSLFPIIGGPSAGKTSIINELHKEGHLICKESATDVILDLQSKGIQNPWDMNGFEIIIFDEKLRREEDAYTKAKMLGKSSIFVDRGLLDQIVYLETLNKLDSKDSEYIMNKLETLDAKSRYKAIFFVEPYNKENFEITKYASTGSNFSEEGLQISKKIEAIKKENGIDVEIRREDTKEALVLSSKLKEVYMQTGLPFFVVPSGLSPKERASFILEKVAELNAIDKNAR